LVAKLEAITQGDCAQAWGLHRGLMTAIDYHGHIVIEIAPGQRPCQWLIVDKDQAGSLPQSVDMTLWDMHTALGHPRVGEEDLLIYRRR
jgi:hypothetical protein